MKQRRPVRIFVAAAIATATLAWATQFALGAVVVVPPRLAQSYTTWLSRAYDPCTAPAVTVTSAGLPSGGCVAANVSTDNSVKMKMGRLSVGLRGKVVLMMTGATVGDQVNVQLMLRVTLPAKATQYTGSKPVTFPDQSVVCGPFTASWSGAIIGSKTLSQCLGSSSGLAAATGSTNIEIVGAQVTKQGDNLPIAASGVLR